jgi:hypothetical protein
MREFTQARFDLTMPASQRRELAALAAENGLSSSDLARLAIKHLLRNPQVVLQPAVEQREVGR